MVENQFGRQLVRNRSHVKPIGASSILNGRANSQDVPNVTPRYPSPNLIPVNRYALNSS